MKAAAQPHSAAQESMRQIQKLSNDLVSDRLGTPHPSENRIDRSNNTWQLTPFGSSDRSAWKKMATRTASGMVHHFEKKGIGTGLVPISKGLLTNFTAPGLQRNHQTAQPVGPYTGLAISQKGEVVLAVPNLAKGSELDKVGVTQEEMENLTTTTSAAAQNKIKEAAITGYWNEIAAVADRVGLVSQLLKLNSSNGPHFNLSLQTHRPQHLRLPFAQQQDFRGSNPFFQSNGTPTNLLATAASILKQSIAPGVPRSLPPASVGAAASVGTTQTVAQTLGISVLQQPLQQVANADMIVIPAADNPNFGGAAGSSYLGAQSSRAQAQMDASTNNFTPAEKQSFTVSGATLSSGVSDANGAEVVFVHSPRHRSNLSSVDNQANLAQAYLNVLTEAMVNQKNHIAVPLISAGRGFTEADSVAAAAKAMDDFKTHNPGSHLQMTLCNPIKGQGELDKMLTDATEPLRKSASSSVPTAAAPAQTVAQTLGISALQQPLQQVANADMIVIPAADNPNFGSAAGSSYLGAQSSRVQAQMNASTNNFTPEEKQSFTVSGATLSSGVSDANGAEVVFVHSPRHRSNLSQSNNQANLAQAYLNVLTEAMVNQKSHVAVPLISAGRGFTEADSVAAAARAMDDFKTHNPGSHLQMTLCNPLKSQAELDDMLTNGTSFKQRTARPSGPMGGATAPATANNPAIQRPAQVQPPAGDGGCCTIL